jgi:hypothetical protein
LIYMLSNHSSAWKLRRDGHEVGWMIGCDGWRKPQRGAEQMPYALDNGMYFPFGGQPHGPARLGEFFGRVGKAHEFHAPLFSIVPDMPYDSEETMRRYTFWSKPCRELAPAWRWGIAVQNRMLPSDLERLGVLSRPDRAAVCVGGDDVWKDSTIPMWAKWCRTHGVWCHVLRVNDSRRLARCMDEGVSSVDGTGLFPGGPGAKAAGAVVSVSAGAVRMIGGGE